MVRRVYKRPTLYYECFELMNAIAACTIKVNASGPSSCYWEDENQGIVVFQVGIVEACETGLTSYHVNAGVTYEGENSTVFGS